MRITLLGTGTSQGIPVIGCRCDTCTSSDFRDIRLRCSVLVESTETSVVIDVGPDFRAQMLKHDVSQVDAVLLTHEHNDHIIGMDDLRPFLFTNPKPILIHGEKRVLDDLKIRFRYAFEVQPYPGAPEFEIREMDVYDSLKINDISFLPLRVYHGQLPILAFKVGTFAYLTDTNAIPDKTMKQLDGLDVLVIDALRHSTHHSHYSLDESLEVIRKIQPKKAFITHVSHMMGPAKVWEKSLPSNVYPAYDGLQFEL